MISPDLLHQVIKGTFKDHLVAWICDYVINTHGATQGDAILDEIDRRYVTNSDLKKAMDFLTGLGPA
jgi:hypothetical protein